MEGNELSYNEYLKCNNACVKVTINRYRGLCSGTLREVCDAIPSLLRLFEEPERLLPTDPRKILPNTFMIIRMYVNFNHTLNQNALAKAEKCKATDLSSLKAVFGRIVAISKGIDQHFVSLVRIPAVIHMMRLLRELLERYDPRHPSLRFFRLLMLHNFLFPEVIEGGKLLATLVLKRPYCQRLFRFTEQDFEPEEIHHGSGIVIANNFVITNKHVTEDAVSDETLEVCIQNETIGELPCVVVHCDAASDLALLYCPGLDLKRHGICEFLLSKEKLWPSLPVFSFGYPLTHTGISALFVKAYVSGFKERYGREPFVVLNCVLNHGNSGGPVFRRIGNKIKLVGVVAQKHKKEILTLKEIKILEEEHSILEEEDLSSEEECSILEEEQINGAADSRDHFWRSLSLKLYDALNETHCQFGYGNVVPGHLVVEFLSDPTVASIMSLVKKVERCIETDEFDAQG